jgi:hypothetical protein
MWKRCQDKLQQVMPECVSGNEMLFMNILQIFKFNLLLLVDNSDINFKYSLVQELYSHNVEVKLTVCSMTIKLKIHLALLHSFILYMQCFIN